MRVTRATSCVVWGQQCYEVSAFVQTSSSVKIGGRPEARASCLCSGGSSVRISKHLNGFTGGINLWVECWQLSLTHEQKRQHLILTGCQTSFTRLQFSEKQGDVWKKHPFPIKSTA